MQQLVLFPDSAVLPRLDAHTQAHIDAEPDLDITSATMDALQDTSRWRRTESGLLIREDPIPFTVAFYLERRSHPR